MPIFLYIYSTKRDTPVKLTVKSVKSFPEPPNPTEVRPRSCQVDRAEFLRRSEEEAAARTAFSLVDILLELVLLQEGLPEKLPSHQVAWN